MSFEEIFQKDKENYLQVFSRSPIVLSHGQGAYVFDTNGKKYLDFLAGIAVNVVGHANEKLVATIANQAQKLIHCSNLYYTEEQANCAERLTKLSHLNKVFFANSGAEANEGAIKLARKYATTQNPEKIEIIVAKKSFHGRTMATLAATGQDAYHVGFGPLPEGFLYVEYGNIDALKKLVNEKTCAVMLETIQGEGGVYVPPENYLKQVRALCDEVNACLILDEIQCGMGRTGKFFAYENFGVLPDIVTLAKGLAGGVPIGAFIAKDKVAEAFHKGDHGSTFGGNALACAAANTVIDIVCDEKFLKHVQETGEFFKNGLLALQKKYADKVEEVRGMGLMLGMELKKPGASIVQACLEKGLIINCTVGKVLRFVPPLMVTKEEVQIVLDVLDEVLKDF